MVNVFIFKAAAIVLALAASATAKLETVKLKHPYGSTAEVSLFGAHVTSFCTSLDPQLNVLFMSDQSPMDGVRPISGGIPIVFPNFGSAPGLPFHGFARTSNWTLDSQTEAADNDSPSVATFTLASNHWTRKIWPFDFKLKYVVKLTSNRLDTALHVHNLRMNPIKFQALLHNYLWVDDVSNNGVQIKGLKGIEYFDKVAGVDRMGKRPLITIAKEIDNVYKNAPDEVHVGIRATDPLQLINDSVDTVDVAEGDILESNPVARTVTINKVGYTRRPGSKKRFKTQTDVVVWNPWIHGAEDFDDEEYKHMIAIEPGRVSKYQTLQAGQTFVLRQNITVDYPLAPPSRV